MTVSRWTAIAALLAAPVIGACSAPAATPAAPSKAQSVSSATPSQLKDLERQYDVRLGVYAVNLATGKSVVQRANERFPILSTFKTYACAALLHEHPLRTGYFDRRIFYTEADLVANSPATSTHLKTGMTVAELCAAAINLSDNTAGNLLLKQLGGPAALTRFARSTGDPVTRLDRWETDLNTAIPGDPRDTSSPRALGTAYRSFVLGGVVGAPERAQLKKWLIATTTGLQRLRAGLPAGWVTGDKTGTGDYGSANDIAITWTDKGVPILIAVQSTKSTANATTDNAMFVATAKIVVQALR